MSVMVGFAAFWIFQLLNTFTALALVFFPRRFHESMLHNPKEAYEKLGFSDTAIEMLHNVLRGQGAALLAISLTLIYLGASDRASYLLIALTCGLALVSQLLTARHHRRSERVMAAIGGDMKSMYGMLAVNAVVAAAAFYTFLAWAPRS